LLIGEFNSSIMPGFLFRSAFLPVAKNELVLGGVGSGKGETLRVSKVGDEEHLYYSGFDLKKKTVSKEK